MDNASTGAVQVWAKFQFSGSAGVAGFTGSGVRAVGLSGSTYTLAFSDAWPQVAALNGQLLLNSSYWGTASGSADIVFNGAQTPQLNLLYSGTDAAATGSGTNQTIDFVVTLGNTGTPVVLPYFSGTNWGYIAATMIRYNWRG